MRHLIGNREMPVTYRTQTDTREKTGPRYRLDVLTGSVGRNGTNNRLDVAKVESLLGTHGYFDLDATGGPTGYAGVRLENATKRFQKDKGLRVDGRLAPGGETIMTLAMSKVPEKPMGTLPEYDPEGRLPSGGRVTINDPVTGKQRPPTYDEFMGMQDLLVEEPRGILRRALEAISGFVERMRDPKPMVIDGPTYGGIRSGG